jgi:hypothetical protein
VTKQNHIIATDKETRFILHWPHVLNIFLATALIVLTITVAPHLNSSNFTYYVEERVEWVNPVTKQFVLIEDFDEKTAKVHFMYKNGRTDSMNIGTFMENFVKVQY